MAWPFWLLAAMAWLALWVWIAAARATAKEGDAVIATFRVLLPAFCVTTCLAAFVAVPWREAVFHKITLWAHHASILLMFLFLITAEYFQAEAWWRIRRGSGALCVAASIRRLWILTETVPAPVALTILLTGLRLIWDLPEINSPSRAWLLGLIFGFSLFFWDGIFGYQPIVRRAWENSKRALAAEVTADDAAAAPYFFMDTLQLFVHFFSWPWLFLLGLFRWNPGMALTKPAAWVVESLHVLPAGWPGVVAAALLWLAVGIAVLLFRAAFKLHRKFE